MNAPFDPARRRLLAAAAAVPVAGLVAACAGTPGAVDGPPAPAPVLKPGDRWFYSGRDGFRDPLVWDETREVVRVEPGLIDVSCVRRGPRIDASRSERWTSPGDLLVGAVFDFETRRFTRPLPRWRYPLAPGDVWSLFADNVNEPSGRPGTINYHARVGGWRSIATPAGTFDAVGVRVMIRLDDGSSGARRPSATISSGTRPTSATRCARSARPSTSTRATRSRACRTAASTR